MEGYNFYMINMMHSTHRKKTMQQKYDKNNLICVEAVDGSYLYEYSDVILPSNLEGIKNSKYSITDNEVACTLSHIKAIKMAYENNENEVFIIEDDTHNTYKSIWNKNLRTIISEKPYDAECIIFFTSSHDLQRKLIATKEDFVKHKKTNGTGVYYINRSGMKKIYDHYIKDGKIDLSNIGGRGDLLADGFALYTRMNSYHYSKPTFIDECKTSTIHQRHITRHEINNNIILDYFMKKEYFDIVENKYVFKKNIKEEKSIEKIGTETSMDQLINNKIFLLNEHKQDCTCEKCKLLMQEIRTLLNEKKNVITKA